MSCGRLVKLHMLMLTDYTKTRGKWILVFMCAPQSFFYPTALRSCQGIVFTHCVRMGGWLALALSKCLHLPYLRHVSLIAKIYGLLQLIII